MVNAQSLLLSKDPALLGLWSGRIGGVVDNSLLTAFGLLELCVVVFENVSCAAATSVLGTRGKSSRHTMQPNKVSILIGGVKQQRM